MRVAWLIGWGRTSGTIMETMAIVAFMGIVAAMENAGNYGFGGGAGGYGKRSPPGKI